MSEAPAAEARRLLSELAANLRWSWRGECDDLFRDLDPELWRRVNHNPSALLAEVGEERIEARASGPEYLRALREAAESLRSYLRSDRHWAARNTSALLARPVAYFSAEFALHESLPVYSGGLGVLAGDHLKSCSDLGLPVWGVSILYRQGYFAQSLDAQGVQHERYAELDLGRVPLEPVRDARGQPLAIQVPTHEGMLPVALWQARVGRARLILLDGAGDPSERHRRAFALRLYGGDLRTRLLQELVLGVGGYRALLSMGLRPGVLHLNEGHSALATLEAVAQTMEEEGLPFEPAAQRVRARTVFTTHTPVQAGHDRFPPDLIGEFLAPLRERLGLSHEALLALGRVNAGDPGEPFCMTVLALKLSSRANAVSALHARTSRSMWQGLRSAPQAGSPSAGAPIGHVTNGVHVPTWIAPQMARFLDEALGPGWPARLCRPETWEKIYDVPPASLWEVKRRLKQRLLAFVERRLRQSAQAVDASAPRHSEPPADAGDPAAGAGDPPAPAAPRPPSAPGPLPDPQALTIGVARRFVEYKRANLLFAEPDRLARLLADPARPVQILFAGKAHPQDETGKAILRAIHDYSRDERFRGRVFLLEDHDLNVARHLVQGCDLWLNTPRRPLEACGTSGQKAVFNATLHLSSLDGWWAEAYDGLNGFAFGEGLTHTDTALHDRRDAEDLYDVLETVVIREFYERSEGGAPLRWMARVQRALATLAWRYNSDRMAIEYITRCYLPACGAITSEFPPAAS